MSSRIGAGSGADSVSSRIGAGSGADSVSSRIGAGSGTNLGMPAARTDTSGGSNTLVISPGQRGASPGVDAVSRSSSTTPPVNGEPTVNKANSKKQLSDERGPSRLS